MNNRSASSRPVWLLPPIIALGAGGFWLWHGAQNGDRRTVEQIEPGVTLTTIERSQPRPFKMYVVNTNFAQGWRLRPVLADGAAGQAGAALRRTAVSYQLATFNRVHKSTASVAVNGGFFAYEGGAVGAVKLDGQWVRLPWKNRTAVGFEKNGKAKIGNLQGTARVVFGNGTTVPIAALNGYPVKNGVTVLTSEFAREYTLKPDELLISVDKAEIARRKESGRSGISPEGFLLVANGSARALLQGIPMSSTAVVGGDPVETATSARFNVVTTPAGWQDYPTILGAGPRLVKNGKVHSTEVEEEFRPDVTQSGPRTAIGIDKDGNYFLVVVESGVQNGTGLTLSELAREMAALGAIDAINLDGGASVALVVKDRVVTPQGQEVPVANSVVVVRDKDAASR